MDTFMDQLSQKLNAQEIIRANGEAEAEQMTMLQAQVQEYRDCLDRMKQVAEDLGGLQNRIAALSDFQEQGPAAGGATSEDLRELKEQVAALAERQNAGEELKQIREELAALAESRQSAGFDEEALQALRSEFEALSARGGQDTEELRQIREQLVALTENRLRQISAEIAALAENSAKSGADEEALRGIREQMAQITRQNGEQLSKLSQDLMQSVGTEDDFHKECVRIYRNVQAVILEESGKLQEASKLETERVQKSVKGVKTLAILALIASILSIAAPFVTKFLL